MTFALSLDDTSFMYHHCFESSIWPFRINKYEIDYLKDNLPEDIRNKEWVRVEKELRDRDITLTAIYKPSHSCYFIND